MPFDITLRWHGARRSAEQRRQEVTALGYGVTESQVQIFPGHAEDQNVIWRINGADPGRPKSPAICALLAPVRKYEYRMKA